MSRFLADIGLILEYADILAGAPDPAASSALLDTQLCLQHVASLARLHLPFICGKGWPALAHQVITFCPLPLADPLFPGTSHTAHALR